MTVLLRKRRGYEGLIAVAALLLSANPVQARGIDAELVSISSAGAQGNHSSYGPSISADGRYVSFHSYASNLVGGDTNRTWDVFVRDLTSGETNRVSVASYGTQANDESSSPSISADGRFVVFMSEATNLVVGESDSNFHTDVFVHDREKQTTVLVSDPGDADNAAFDPAISADGRFVVWSGSSASAAGVLLRDLATGSLEQLDVGYDGEPPEYGSWDPDISDDGRFVTWHTYASNIVPGDTNDTEDVFIRDRLTGITSRLSTGVNGTQSNGSSRYPAVSDNARYVAFHSWASNLVSGDTNRDADIFVYNLSTGETTRVSVGRNGRQANDDSEFASVQGNLVTFGSDASNLVPGDTNGVADIFVHNVKRGKTRIMSRNSYRTRANGMSWSPDLATDTRVIAFWSRASNLVAEDANGRDDVFLVRTRRCSRHRVELTCSMSGPFR